MMNKKNWPTNKEVNSYVSSIPVIDERTVFDYYLKSAMIVGEITPQEYIKMEVCLDGIRHMVADRTISKIAKRYFYTCLES